MLKALYHTVTASSALEGGPLGTHLTYFFPCRNNQVSTNLAQTVREPTSEFSKPAQNNG